MASLEAKKKENLNVLFGGLRQMPHYKKNAVPIQTSTREYVI